jgi:hypothetical protein
VHHVLSKVKESLVSVCRSIIIKGFNFISAVMRLNLKI